MAEAFLRAVFVVAQRDVIMADEIFFYPYYGAIVRRATNADGAHIWTAWCPICMNGKDGFRQVSWGTRSERQVCERAREHLNEIHPGVQPA